MKLKVLRLDPRAFLPTCSHPGTALGFDLYSMVETTLYPGEVQKVPTGVAIEMKGYGFLICDRSSMSMQGITSSGGVIDSDYRGGIVANLTLERGRPPYSIHYGDRIAQLVPVKTATLAKIVEVLQLSKTERGMQGYGSTGR